VLECREVLSEEAKKLDRPKSLFVIGNFSEEGEISALIGI